MNILLFGKNGQVGAHLTHSLARLGEVVALSSESTNLCGNLAVPDGIRETIRSVSPDVIVNAAAYTAVDRAECEPQKAHLMNTEAPAAMADEAQKCGAWLVHYSTDYVFDGSGEQPWKEVDITRPINVYGRTKRLGEEAIELSGCKHLILRSSWIYASSGTNFIRTILRLAKERDTLDVITDQVGAPTGADFLANFSADMIERVRKAPELGGLYHVSAEGETSWYAYAVFLIEFARKTGLRTSLSPSQVHPIASAAYPTPAKRPKNSRLDLAKVKGCFGLNVEPWQIGVERNLSEIIRSEAAGLSHL